MASIWLKAVGALAALGVIGGVGFVAGDKAGPQPKNHWANLGEPDLAKRRAHLLGRRLRQLSCGAGRGGEAKLVLSGGAPLKSPVRHIPCAPISPRSQCGIGAWTLAELVMR